MRRAPRGTTVQALSLLFAASLVLAGCIGGAPTDAVPDPDAAGGDGQGGQAPGGEGGGAPIPDGDVATGRAPPTWRVGDWWTYRATGPGIDYETTLVVVEETSDAWVIASDNPQMTFFDDRFDISFMGPQYRSNLAGSQGSDEIRFFQWPLVEGEGWFTPWDYLEVHIAVQSVVPDRSRVELVAHDPDGNVDVSYAYEPRVRWFTEMTFFDDNGTETFSLDLQDSGRDYAGTYLSVEVEEVVDDRFEGFGGGFWQVTVDDEDDDFWWQATLEATSPGLVGIGYHYDGGDDPTASGGDQLFGEICPCEPTQMQGTLSAEPAGGWSFEGGATVPAGGYLDLTIVLRDFVEHTLGGDGAEGG